MDPSAFYTNVDHFPIFATGTFGSLIALQALNIKKFYVDVEGEVDSIKAQVNLPQIRNFCPGSVLGQGTFLSLDLSSGLLIDGIELAVC